ncbi:PHP domain-containing protein [Nocardioides sambongensis]|uniref:PHP domain-containing protein n=1 Tax=Nocardioides sambongensis TaxID=2589074 RepID=UPI001128B695|nr:PHP domain-containing protein [Nocardioides sambongensis]
MQIDLHTHSAVSDGTDTPTDLVRAAAAAGLDVVGLTDHDTTAGWAEAATAAASYGIVVAPGIEISTRHQGAGVHLLAYLPDPTDAALLAALDRIVAGRDERTPAMLARLRELGIPATEEALAEVAGRTVVTGRPHVADLLVRLGVVPDRDAAFAGYLAEGGPAFVDRYAADLTATVGLVVAAGGVPVIAHPWGRGSRRVLDPTGLAGLRDAGLAGLEVDHLDHGPAERAELRGIAEDLGLLVTGSSDHHGAGKVGHDLGCETTAPEVWEAIQDRARRNGSPVTAFGG